MTALRWKRGGGVYSADVCDGWRATIAPSRHGDYWRPRLVSDENAVAIDGPCYGGMTLARAKAWVDAMRPVLGIVGAAGTIALRAVTS